MKSERTKESIFENARTVFIEKGLTAVTMTDIVEASGLSRGGVYRYYNSVNEVFEDLTERDLSKGLMQFSSFDAYLAYEFNNLKHVETTLARAGYEYMLKHGNESKLASKIQNTNINLIQKLLQCDIGTSLEIFLLLEGLNVMALSGTLNTEILESMFKRIKEYGK